MLKPPGQLTTLSVHPRNAAFAQHGRPNVVALPEQAAERVTRFAGNAGSENWPFWLDVEVRDSNLFPLHAHCAQRTPCNALLLCGQSGN